MNDREKMQDKIKALLSKTVERGCTQEEELAALAKARALMPTATANSRALVVVKQQVIKAKMDELEIKLRKCSGSAKQQDTGSRDAGRSAGDRASFGRPVSGRAGALHIGNGGASR